MPVNIAEMIAKPIPMRSLLFLLITFLRLKTNTNAITINIPIAFMQKIARISIFFIDILSHNMDKNQSKNDNTIKNIYLIFL